MIREPVYVGIDVSKAELEVSVWPIGEASTVPNSAAGISRLIKRLIELDAQTVAFEHTGNMTRDLTDALREAEIPSVILDSRKVRWFATVVGRSGKTDRLDAELIAQFAATLKPNVSPLPTAEERALADLVRRHRQLTVIAGSERVKHGQDHDAEVVRSVEAHLAWLKGDLTELAAIIDARIEARPEWRFRRDLIRSMPGCGPVFARVAIAELPELGRTEHKRLVSLVGVAPIPKDSGKSQGKRRVRGGRFGVRTALYMASISATRTNPDMAAYYGRLVLAGKPRMVARVATMRKMLIALNAMVRDGREWSPRKCPEAELLVC